jgi:hypothetical protein
LLSFFLLAVEDLVVVDGGLLVLLLLGEIRLYMFLGLGTGKSQKVNRSMILQMSISSVQRV